MALIATAVLIGAIGSLQGRQSERAEKAPYAYKQTAKADAENVCISGTSSDIFECVYDKVETSSQRAHDDQDLFAQELAAWSALTAAGAGIATLIISVLGLIYIRDTLAETRVAVGETVKANVISESTAKQQLRAYVGASEFRLSLEAGEIPRVSFKWVNAGQTPAMGFAFIALGIIVPKAFDRDEIKVRFENIINLKAKANILPGREIKAGYSFDKPVALSFVKDFEKGEISLVVAGLAIYRDIFGRRRLATFKRYADAACHTQFGKWEMRNCVTGNRFN